MDTKPSIFLWGFDLSTGKLYADIVLVGDQILSPHGITSLMMRSRFQSGLHTGAVKIPADWDSDQLRSFIESSTAKRLHEFDYKLDAAGGEYKKSSGKSTRRLRPLSPGVTAPLPEKSFMEELQSL